VIIYSCVPTINLIHFFYHIIDQHDGDDSPESSFGIVTELQGDPLARGPKIVYLQIFNEFVNQLTDDELTTGYYQQDGATYHTSNASMREIERFLKTELSQKIFGHPDLPI